MVELRWLTRTIDYTGVSQGHQPDTETVFQYRVWEQKIDLKREEAYMAWSDWHDVPRVEDLTILRPASKGIR